MVREFALALALWAQILSGLGAANLILCIHEDGALRVEPALLSCCAPERLDACCGSRGPATGDPVGSFIGEGSTCGSCSDYPLGFGDPKALPGTDNLRTISSLQEAALTAAILPQGQSQRPASPLAPLPPHRTPSWGPLAHLRTVIQLI